MPRRLHRFVQFFSMRTYFLSLNNFLRTLNIYVREQLWSLPDNDFHEKQNLNLNMFMGKFFNFYLTTKCGLHYKLLIFPFEYFQITIFINFFINRSNTLNCQFTFLSNFFLFFFPNTQANFARRRTFVHRRHARTEANVHITQC